jgi:hypothetical protein
MTMDAQEHLRWLEQALYFTVLVGEEREHPNLRPLTDRQLDRLAGDHLEQLLAALVWAEAHPTFPFQTLKPEMKASGSAIYHYLRGIRRDLLARRGPPEGPGHHVPSLRQALYYVVHRQMTAAEFLNKTPVPRGPDLRPLDADAMEQVLGDHPHRVLAALRWAKDHPEFAYSTLYDDLPSDGEIYEYLCRVLKALEPTEADRRIDLPDDDAWVGNRSPAETTRR